MASEAWWAVELASMVPMVKKLTPELEKAMRELRGVHMQAFMQCNTPFHKEGRGGAVRCGQAQTGDAAA